MIVIGLVWFIALRRVARRRGSLPVPRAVTQGLPFEYPRASFAPYIGRARSLRVSFRQFRSLAALFRFQRGGLRLL